MMVKEKRAMPEEIPKQLEKRLSKNGTKERETIKVTASSLPYSNKEIRQQYNNIKTIMIESNTKAEDAVDPEVLKELNKHNFKNVAEFYEFLESVKLKGLVKVMSASKSSSDNRKSLKIQPENERTRQESAASIEGRELDNREVMGISIEKQTANVGVQKCDSALTSQPLKSAKRSTPSAPTVIEYKTDPLNKVQSNINIEEAATEDLPFVGKKMEGNFENEEKINEIQSEISIKQNDETTLSFNNKINSEPLDNTKGGESEFLEINRDTPVALPSHIPDPSEFLKKPIMGIVDYSRIACDGSSRLYDDNSKDFPPFQSNSNFSIPENFTKITSKIDEQIEFSNSPKFISDAQELEECLIEKNLEESTMLSTKVTFLSNNSNFYSSGPASVVNNEVDKIYEIMDEDESSKNEDKSYNVNPDIFKELNESSLDNETKINNLLESLDPDKNTSLPLKKRRMSVSIKLEDLLQESKSRETSFPATPMMSIAEVEALRKFNFKTLAERKQLPPLPPVYLTTVPTTTNGQYTIHPTTSNIAPYLPIPCASYYTIPPVLLPYNNVPTYEDESNIVPQDKCSRHPINRTRRIPEKNEKTNQ